MTFRGWMGHGLTVAVTCLALLAPAGTVAMAQDTGATREQRPRQEQDRGALEEQLRQRLAEIARRELDLTDAQFTRLQEVNRRFDGERRQLITRERRARLELRRQLHRGEAADEARVGTLLDELMAAQRARFEVLESEQRALAAFLTPVQRARYMGLQEGFRRQLEQRRQNVRERGERRGPPASRPPGSGGA